ncbi:MAG: hypothetical protein HY962_04870 [Ignavibacteriae bacterium]|nr:hypothetical protein [Ignavibacteriota bacterium]
MWKASYVLILLSGVIAMTQVLRAQELRIPESASLSSPTVARQFHYQGCLTKPDGTPQPDGTYQMKFEIIDQTTSPGSVVFSEAASITTKKGLFEHAIGSVDTVGNRLNPAIFQRRVALRLTVNGETLQPLIPIYSVPIAMHALYADSLRQPLPAGPAGPKGVDGINCWDLDGDGVKDANEDKNTDGKWDAADCIGPQGPAGPRGPAGPPGGAGGKDTVSIVRTDSLVVLTISEHYGPEYYIYDDPITGKKDTTRIYGGQIWIGDGKGGVAVSFDQRQSIHNIPELYIYTDPQTGKSDTSKIHGGQILIGDGRGGTTVLFDQEKSVHNVPEFYIYTDPASGKKDTTLIHGGALSTTAFSVLDAKGNVKVAFSENESYHEVPETYVHINPTTGKRDTTVIDGGSVTGRNIGVVDGSGNLKVTFDENKSVHRVPEYYIRTDPSTGKADTTILNGSQIIGSRMFIRDDLGRVVGQITPTGMGTFTPGSPIVLGFITQGGTGDFHGLVVRDSAGNATTFHDRRGHSFHYRPETFYGGVTVPLENGNIMRLDPLEGLSIKTPTGGFVGHLNPQGSFYFIGTKNNIVPTASYGTRQMYAVEAPDVRYSDYGSAQLVDGEAEVRLDPMFLETVTIDEEHPMIVTLTPSGDCRGLYVARKGTDRFLVRELSGGRSSIEFDWQIVVKRRGYENARMESYQRAATREEMQSQQKSSIEAQQIPAPEATDSSSLPTLPDATPDRRVRGSSDGPARRRPVPASSGTERGKQTLPERSPR